LNFIQKKKDFSAMYSVKEPICNNFKKDVFFKKTKARGDK